MSYSISFNIDPFLEPKDFVAAAHKGALTPHDETNNAAATTIGGQIANKTGPEFLAAIEQGAVSAWSAAQVIGQNAVEVRVSISGHVNPNHMAADGWSNDFQQISINVVEYYAVPSWDEETEQVDAKVTIPGPLVNA